MKKILASLLALGMLFFWGCSYEKHCDVTNQAKLEYLWCPRLDSAIVEWMPKVEKLTSSYKELADCERFENGYEPQHDLLSKCESDSVTSKFNLRFIARPGTFRLDSGVVTLIVNMQAYSDNGVSSPFYDDIATVFLVIYGCNAYGCKNAEKVHVYIEEGVSIAHILYALPKDEERITYDQWLIPENFKIVETNSNPPSSSDGYYRYHHFRLIVDSPSIKTTVETQCDSNCYNSWETLDFSVPIGG